MEDKEKEELLLEISIFEKNVARQAAIVIDQVKEIQMRALEGTLTEIVPTSIYEQLTINAAKLASLKRIEKKWTNTKE